MSTDTSENDSCRKRGVVMTCYIDGHKRFRAMSLEPSDKPERPDIVTALRRGDLSSSREAASGILRRYSY